MFGGWGWVYFNYVCEDIYIDWLAYLRIARGIKTNPPHPPYRFNRVNGGVGLFYPTPPNINN